MIELPCPYCKEDHEIPEDCEYGGEFTAPCGNVVEVAYDEQYDEENDDVYSWYLLYKSKKDRVTITSTPLTSRSILTEFSKLDGAYRCPLHQKSGEWPDNPCPVCASNALKLDLSPPLELDVEAAEAPIDGSYCMDRGGEE
jgi:hypothetical protein